MTTQPFEQFEQHGPLTQIQEGMDVYDRADEKVGTVKEVFMGDGDQLQREEGLAPATSGEEPMRDSSLLDNLAESITPADRLPEGARERLRREGYVAIDRTGIFTGNCFASADQIATVQEDRVLLNVTRDELTTN